ncbi:hypothetical protein [Chromobacterium subtsugae]|uniref:hypothetical protein n=1 Tax=Chromobacterium subtsugae TaxID=251747 RepID=UPI000A75D62A|nr:hypothetical protein [Chromobacterium subtsugae]
MSKPEVFEKSFPYLNPDDVQHLYRHSLAVERSIDGIGDITTPRVLACDGLSIHYQYLELGDSFHHVLSGDTDSNDYLFRIGKALKAIHSYQLSESARSLLHSDFVPHNIFISGTKITLIDPHPPEKLDFSTDRLYGNPYSEIVDFIFCLMSDVGFKRSITKLGLNVSHASSFFDGYGKSNLTIHIFFRPIFYKCKDSYILKRRAGFPLTHATLHCVAGSILTLLVLWKAL